jgi:hypothetical protein
MSGINEITEPFTDLRDVSDWKQFHFSNNLSSALSIDTSGFKELFLWKEAIESEKAEGLLCTHFQPNYQDNDGANVWCPIIVKPSMFGINGLALYIFDVETPDHYDLWDLRRKQIH